MHRPAPTLTYSQARELYDRFGAKRDWQRLYEDPALRCLIQHARFSEARSIVEFGCGTGQLAEQLLRRTVPPSARYLALDASETMVSLARGRLALFGDRVQVRLTDGPPRIAAPAESFDRFVSTYVLDLLSETDIYALLAEAHRVLERGGLLALVSLAHGATPVARLVERVWARLHAWRPALVGGCRAIALGEFLEPAAWQLARHTTVTRFGISSDVVVAARIK